MTKEDKISLIAEAMDVPASELDENTNLTKMEEWDSLAVLSFMSILMAKFGKSVTPPKVASIVTVGDALKLME